ncbi:hypothetical protein BKA70DRAFT_607218 [Coprinopsis sp. MPI-PUGE-AT-0042]|nr:hypothetical protein BKA70DRAFT_607218 [Coprinopsis sp. MPI-PUGE-AT-0042]
MRRRDYFVRDPIMHAFLHPRTTLHRLANPHLPTCSTQGHNPSSYPRNNPHRNALGFPQRRSVLPCLPPSLRYRCCQVLVRLVSGLHQRHARGSQWTIREEKAGDDSRAVQVQSCTVLQMRSMDARKRLIKPQLPTLPPNAFRCIRSSSLHLRPFEQASLHNIAASLDKTFRTCSDSAGTHAECFRRGGPFMLPPTCALPPGSSGDPHKHERGMR